MARIGVGQPPDFGDKQPVDVVTLMEEVVTRLREHVYHFATSECRS